MQEIYLAVIGSSWVEVLTPCLQGPFCGRYCYLARFCLGIQWWVMHAHLQEKGEKMPQNLGC